MSADVEPGLLSGASRPGASLMPELAAGRTVKRLSDTVVAALMDELTSGAYAPGDRLPPEREIGTRFGVSRTVVRDALRLLAFRGVVVVRPGSGIFVARVDSSATTESLKIMLQGSIDLGYEKVHEVRETIEARVVELAAERATDAELARLDALLARMVEARGGEPFAIADAEFHLTLAELAHNELFRLLLDAIGGVMIEVRRRTAYLPGAREHAAADHRRIADALVRRDARAAREAMQEHLSQVRTAVRELDESVRRSQSGSAQQP